MSTHPPPSTAYSLSVRDFVEPLLRTGSIDSSFSLRQEEDPLQLGTKAHTRIQRRLKKEHPHYLSEVAVHGEFREGDIAMLVRGKLDGLFPAGEGAAALVEEIKTTFRPHTLLRQLQEDPEHPYALQAQMYAWLLENKTSQPCACRLRIVSLVDDEETLLSLNYSHEQFGTWVQRHLEEHFRERRRVEAREKERSELAKHLRFPFVDLRQGQQEIIATARKALDEGHNWLIQAPTGLGKSAAILFPSLQWAMEHASRVFYATPRNSQHGVAEDAMQRLNACGFPVRSVTIRAKEKVCPTSPMICKPEHCPRAHLHFDRMHASGALDEIARKGTTTADDLVAIADFHALCPFELSLDAATHADVVICDYNYVFAPGAQLYRFFGSPEQCARNVVLIDEAHNLPSRATDWFSPTLSRAWLKSIDRSRKEQISSRSTRMKVRRILTACEKALTLHEGPSRLVALVLDQLARPEREMLRLLGNLVSTGVELPPNHPLQELYRGWSDFCNLARSKGDESFSHWNAESESLQICCADASTYLAGQHRLNARTIAFSATLKPFDYHLQLSGLSEEKTGTSEFPSPFPRENRKILVVPQLTSLFRERERQAPRVAEFLSRVLPLRFGNYFVFFPSFDFLERTAGHLEIPGFAIVTQPRKASAAAVNGILERLKQEQGVVVLAVQGGSLSEGIDCPGTSLIGAVVVGPPLPQFSLEREEVRKYFDKKQKNGRDWAYVFPAMARAVQAAGRVIRSPTDKGLLILLDGRFLQDAYARCMPKEWFFHSPHELVSSRILADVSDFWSSVEVNSP